MFTNTNGSKNDKSMCNEKKIFVIFLFFQQYNAVLRIHYLQSLDLKKKRYSTYNTLLAVTCLCF